jgi:hypothetical protein
MGRLAVPTRVILGSKLLHSVWPSSTGPSLSNNNTSATIDKVGGGEIHTHAHLTTN